MNLNFFQLFEIEQSYALNLDALEEAYLKAQQEFHPDNFAHLSPQEQIQFLQKSADINMAYDHLKDHVKRAIHLLDLFGQNNPLKQKPVPQAILETQFEWREKVEDMPAKEVLGNVKLKMNHVQKELEHTFQEKDFARASLLTLELHFFNALKKELKRL